MFLRAMTVMRIEGIIMKSHFIMMREMMMNNDVSMLRQLLNQVCIFLGVETSTVTGAGTGLLKAGGPAMISWQYDAQQ